jgi:hypothetical protein
MTWRTSKICYLGAVLKAAVAVLGQLLLNQRQLVIKLADEERTGSCICCMRRDPLPELQPVCGPCRSRLRNQLREIPDYCAELASLGFVERDGRSTPSKLTYPPGHDDEGKPVPHFEPLANVMPAGPINGESRQPRVGGSREAPVPISLDRADLLSDARVVNLTRSYERRFRTDAERTAYRRLQLDDQIGQPSAASVLDGWCRDFAEGRRESVPQPFVTTQCRWLLDRLDWAFVEHPAIDEAAQEIGDLHLALRRATGRTTPRPEICWGVECRNPDCNYVNTLVRVSGSQWVECTECGLLLSEEEFAEWCRLLVPAARRKLSDPPNTIAG